MGSDTSAEKNATARPGPLMVDVEGLVLNDDDIRRIRHPLTGGVILFSRNYTSREQLTELTRSIRACRPDVLIAVDHEGGRVQRFKDGGFTHLPPMRDLGRLWETDATVACRAAVAVGYVLAAELRACGIDMSLTPVLDLDYGESGVIGDRAFHADPQIVTRLAQSLNHGLLLAGMANCGKHFPGHGFVREDSHTEIPVDDRSLEEILDRDAAPYQLLGIGLSAVMPAHVIYPQVDALPAGFSARWLDILRKELGFEGAIMSDDLKMEGARVDGGVVRAAEMALDAGCDMVLVCNSPADVDLVLSGLNYPEDERALKSRERLLALFPEKISPSWEALQAEPRYLQALEAVNAVKAL